MKTKRVKISFQTESEGKVSIISKEVISDSNKRVKEGMKDVVREFDLKETKSQHSAEQLVLNA